MLWWLVMSVTLILGFIYNRNLVNQYQTNQSWIDAMLLGYVCQQSKRLNLWLLSLGWCSKGGVIISKFHVKIHKSLQYLYQFWPDIETLCVIGVDQTIAVRRNFFSDFLNTLKHFNFHILIALLQWKSKKFD